MLQPSFLFSLVLALTLYSAELSAEQWLCRNSFEASCSEQGCTLNQGDDFTPSSVLLSSEGELEICMYNGCWQGQAQVLAESPYLVLQGMQLQWNNPYTPNEQHALLSLEPSSGVATLQVVGFQLVLMCHRR